jgi:aldoxime dehydratase
VRCLSIVAGGAIFSRLDTGRDPARYEEWNVDSGFEAWWNDPARTRGGEGHFRESLTVPKERFETIFARDYLVGAAKLGDGVLGPLREHGYWGSMCDRFEVAHDDLLSPYSARLPRNASPSSAAYRRVRAPENLTVIRSGQDWTGCVGDEFAFYDESVHPLLRDAMHFLRDHPAETGCCEMRFAQQFTAEGAMLKKTFGLGHFLSLGHLEQGAASDERHLTIFSRFGRMAREFRFGLRLKLWHEVSVLPASGQIFEYINCQGKTGLLPFFPSQEW